MADIFLSYQKRDRDLAERMTAALKAEGLSVWWDDDLTPRESWDRTIEREIAAADHVLVLWTKHSIESDWVRREANYALDCRPSKLVQVRFDRVEIPIAFSLTQYIELQRRGLQRGAAWSRLVEWLRFEKHPEKAKRQIGSTGAISVLQTSPIGHAPQNDARIAFLMFLVGIALELAVASVWFLLTQPSDYTFSETPLWVIPAMPFLFGLPYVIKVWRKTTGWRQAIFFVAVIGAAPTLGMMAGLLTAPGPPYGRQTWALLGAVAAFVGSCISVGLGIQLGCLRKDRNVVVPAIVYITTLTVAGAATLALASMPDIAYFPWRIAAFAPWQALFAHMLSQLIAPLYAQSSPR